MDNHVQKWKRGRCLFVSCCLCVVLFVCVSCVCRVNLLLGCPMRGLCVCGEPMTVAAAHPELRPPNSHTWNNRHATIIDMGKSLYMEQ